MATSVSPASTAAAPAPTGLTRSVDMSFRAVASTRPAATAPMPRSAPETTGFSAKPAYSAAAPTTSTSGTPSMPSSVARAPRRPK